MGLDITAYRKLTAADGEADWEITIRLDAFAELHFPGRMVGVTPGVYTFAERLDFRAGSYSGYNDWRNWLASLAGFGTARALWDTIARDASFTGPFVELINFADNEGVLGPVVSAKLARDFAEFQSRVDALSTDTHGFYVGRYEMWRKAFEIASDHGAVDFH